MQADRLDDLRAALQAEADTVGGSGGSYAVVLPNAATIDGQERSRTVTIGGSIAAAPSPGLGRAFDKTSSLSGQTRIALDDRGELAEPLDVTYTLKADLREFADFAGRPRHLEGLRVPGEGTDHRPRRADHPLVGCAAAAGGVAVHRAEHGPVPLQ